MLKDLAACPIFHGCTSLHLQMHRPMPMVEMKDFLKTPQGMNATDTRSIQRLPSTTVSVAIASQLSRGVLCTYGVKLDGVALLVFPCIICIFGKNSTQHFWGNNCDVSRNTSGEEVSVSLLYSRTKDRLNTPHPCVQEEAPCKTKWVPEQILVKNQMPGKRRRTQRRR